MAAVPIKKQGNLITTETPIYQTPQGKRSVISLIRFKNLTDAAYTVTLYRQTENDKRLIYSIPLDAGDFIDDVSNYELRENDSIIAKGTSITINYIINGEEVDLP